MCCSVFSAQQRLTGGKYQICSSQNWWSPLKLAEGFRLVSSPLSPSLACLHFNVCAKRTLVGYHYSGNRHSFFSLQRRTAFWSAKKKSQHAKRTRTSRAAICVFCIPLKQVGPRGRHLARMHVQVRHTHERRWSGCPYLRVRAPFTRVKPFRWTKKEELPPSLSVWSTELLCNSESVSSDRNRQAY